MSKYFILRINLDGEPVCLYAYDAQNHACTTTVVNHWSNNDLVDKPLLLLLPASWLYHTKTHVASKNIELLNKSIPYAIEEELSNEVEDNYYAFKLNDDSSQSVVAIEKQRLNNVNEQIVEHQLSVEAIYSEVDWVPAKKEVISVWTTGDNSLLRFGLDQAMNVPNHQVNQLLPVFGQQAKSVVCNEKDAIESPGLSVNGGLTEAICCQYLVDHPSINLYVDEVKQAEEAVDQKSWRLVKWLSFLLLASWLGIQLFQIISLNQQIDSIKQQQKDLLQQKYPDAVTAELLDPFAALQSRLQVNNSQIQTKSNILIDAVYHLGTTSKQQPQVILNGLRLIDQKLEVQITAASMTQINEFQQLLQSMTNEFTVRIGVNELADDNTYKSTLTMVPR